MWHAIPIPFIFGEVGDIDSPMATQMTSTVSTRSNSKLFTDFALRGQRLLQRQIIFISVHITNLNYCVSNPFFSVNMHVTQFHGLPVDHPIVFIYINRPQHIMYTELPPANTNKFFAQIGNSVETYN
jgi:hypothetical protein